MKSLSWKIFFGFLLVIFLFTGLILYFSFGTIRHHYLNSTIKNTKIQSLLISGNIIEFLLKNDTAGIRKYIIETGFKTKTRITIIDTSGYAIADSRINPELIENQKSKSDFKKLLLLSDRNRFFSIFESDDMITVSYLLKSNGQTFGLIRTNIYFSEINNITYLLQYDILLISAIIILFSFVFVIFFSAKIIKPIRELSRASRKVALGDFDNKVFIPGNDELSYLARNFNQMTDKLKDYFILAEAQQEQYLTLISSIQSSLIVLDKQGRILLHNKSFENLSKSNLVKGRFYWELIPVIEFSDLIKAVSKKKKYLTREIEFGNLYFICNANYIESKNEIVVLFHDITEIKKLENVKRDFVVNVTHELRTPLTAIKGYIETLEDDESLSSESISYIEIVKRHTDRLINIVQDLLTLSEVEQKSSHIQINKVDISLLFDNMLRIFDQKINNKGLKFIIEKDINLPYLLIDPFRIEQVLINLIDNAIKYTDSGFIRLKVRKLDGTVEFIVEDTGLGIPKEHHGRLFERFYTVDRSRSRKVGGTGLGLSIVKHIVMLHEGEILVESNGAGKGTKFIIRIPQKQFNTVQK